MSHPPQYTDKDAEAGAPLVNQGYPPTQGYPGGYPPPQQYPAQQTTIVVGPQRTSHPDYLGFSIFNLLCCCCCIGIAAIVKSCAVKEANDRGDPRAQAMSKEALTLNKVALGIGIAVNLIWIIAIIVIVVTGASWFSAIFQQAKDQSSSYTSG